MAEMQIQAWMIPMFEKPNHRTSSLPFRQSISERGADLEIAEDAMLIP
jgi:hypothetical protein